METGVAALAVGQVIVFTAPFGYCRAGVEYLVERMDRTSMHLGRNDNSDPWFVAHGWRPGTSINLHCLTRAIKMGHVSVQVVG